MALACLPALNAMVLWVENEGCDLSSMGQPVLHVTLGVLVGNWNERIAFSLHNAEVVRYIHRIFMCIVDLPCHLEASTSILHSSAFVNYMWSLAALHVRFYHLGVDSIRSIIRPSTYLMQELLWVYYKFYTEQIEINGSVTDLYAQFVSKSPNIYYLGR